MSSGEIQKMAAEPATPSGPLTYSPDLTRQLAETRQEVERLRAKADSFDALWQVCIECGMEVHPPGIDEDGELVPEEYAFQFGFIRGLKEKLTAAQAAHGTASQLVSYASSELHRLLGYEPSAASLSTLFTKLEDKLTAAEAALKAAEERASFLAACDQAGYDGAEAARRGFTIDACPYGPYKADGFRDATKQGLWQKGHDIVTSKKRIEAAEQQRDQLQAELAQLRSQVVRGPAELGELIIGDNERLLPKGTYAYAKKDWQSWGCMLVDSDGMTAHRGWVYKPLPLPSSLRLPDEKAKGDA